MNLLNIRSSIYEIISSIEPFDTLEEEHIGFVLRWIESGEEIFRIAKPATPDTHLVAYSVIISEDGNNILLVDHKKASLWLPPGGHVECGENPKETARRETKEELGIEAEFLYDQPLLITVTKTTGKDQHTDVSLWYLLKGDPNKILNFDPEEFHGIQWFKRSQIPFEKSDPHMKRFIDKYEKFYS